jgi:hypothetical protein
MTLMQKDCVDQYHPTVDGFLSSFEFSDFEVQRMKLYLNKSCPKDFQAILVPAIVEGYADVFVVMNFLCFQEVVAMDFDCR